MRGKCFVESEGLMVIGRVVNQWTEETWVPSEFKDRSKREEFIRSIRNLSKSDSREGWKYFVPQNSGCPMSWVAERAGCKTGSNINRSPFWRVIEKVAHYLNATDTEKPLPSYLCWSNLYKLASAKGNPSDWLKTAQQDKCIDLLQRKLITWKPKHILVLAGAGWYRPFLESTETLDERFEKWSEED
jgi:hypothetical protein